MQVTERSIPNPSEWSGEEGTIVDFALECVTITVERTNIRRIIRSDHFADCNISRQHSIHFLPIGSCSHIFKCNPIGIRTDSEKVHIVQSSNRRRSLFHEHLDFVVHTRTF